jgi:LmbE family N-acetylglucosaminyl deacetylase
MLNGRSIVALGAHPDDLEFGCGATLAKLASFGIEIHALVMTKGGQGLEGKFDRVRESENALRMLGVRTVTQYDFPDTRLPEHLNELIAVIELAVEKHDPVRVYTMFDADRHQDHRAVYKASAVACRRVAQVMSYETPSSYPNFVPTLFEPIEHFLEQKVDALKMHESQSDRFYMQEEKVRSAAHFRGVQVDVGPSEGFLPYKMVL